MDRITTEKLRFVDAEGRTRIFNGMNIDDKSRDRKEFIRTLDEEFFKKYRALGLNFIRLAVTWQNLEPEIEKYNEDYLRSIDAIFELAEKYGVYILLDMHQDLYSGNGGKSCGDGAPEWAVITDGAKPRQPIFVWADGYFFGKWVAKSFDNFWNNTPVNGKGLQDRYADLWKMLASRYGDSPALFGFDLMNEPFPGSESKKMFASLIGSAAKNILFSKKMNRKKLIGSLVKRDTRGILDCIEGGLIRDVTEPVDKYEADFDRRKYSPFLNKISAAIREVTDKGIIMMEQCYICNSGVKQSAPPITVNGIREPNQCFGPHGYDMMVDTPLYQYAKSDRVKAFFTEMRNTQLRLNVPVVVGEWGGCSDNTDTSWFPHAYELLDYFDSLKWSQSYWTYLGNDLDSPLMNMLSRTHPVAVASEKFCYRYDRDNKVFTLESKADKAGKNIIYVHKPFTVENGIKHRVLEQYESGAALIAVDTGAGESTIKIKINE
ncbi:MAG: glycoside hydrolase family 5 protein [Eubacterium sp.]|nr:glycoside hydrolase family 5 protein [Eubacterium sp.]